VTTRIEIRQHAALLDASRALQAANQRRLQERTELGWVQEDATRLVRKGLEFSGSQISKAAGRRDPWRGAVPEFEEPGFTPVQVRGRRFRVAGAWWQWKRQARTLTVKTADRSTSATVAIPPALGGLDDGVIWYQAFPAGKGRMVLLFYMQGITYQGSQVNTTTPFNTPGAPAEVIAEAQAWIDLVNADPSTMFPVRISQRYPPFSFGNINTITVNYNNLVLNRVLQCFVVTRSTVAPIDCPVALRELVRQKFYYVDSVTPGGGSRTERIGRGIVTVSEYNPFDPGPEFEPLLPARVFEGLITESTGTISTPQAQFANNRQYQEDPATSLDLLRSYGYGKLLNRTGSQDPAWGWTPAVFSFLKNYTGEFHGAAAAQEQPRAYEYSYIAGQYFPRDTPSIMLEADYRIDPAEAAFYYWFRAPVAVTGFNFKEPTAFRVPPVQPRRAAGPVQDRIVPVASDADQEQAWQNGTEVPLATWDWNRPLACILQLQSLGFTAEDLMLTTEETAALAAADPAEVGFKF
jgi:hypothetical protein